MSERIDLEAIARQTCGIGPAKPTLLDDIDLLKGAAAESAALADELRKRTAERDAWHEHYKQAERQIADLLAQRDALQARVDACDMRAIVGELRAILHDVTEFNRHPAMIKLAALLRRIDLESQQPTTEG